MEGRLLKETFCDAKNVLDQANAEVARLRAALVDLAQIQIATVLVTEKDITATALTAAMGMIRDMRRRAAQAAGIDLPTINPAADAPRIPGKAPWSLAEVSNLEAWQANRSFHGYTCPGDLDCGLPGARLLLPTLAGWVCQCRRYRQDWAHVEHVTGPPTSITSARPGDAGPA